ncbi:DUF58 domain-containing protein [Bifidobacterium oedipodis]|uniref:DUF58 domain-containing protein n=1 Tax=Bifidobacterium oedipodis TaxID=2675322 RepID=A0A7Y0EP16_9BIFI|nr:DUF58 domain-containing protein [Bifidobacterium sp. DSM 109957]NMM93777.1 hypothetical protein [Bifidobacterium sp. DSM 109957]
MNLTALLSFTRTPHPRYITRRQCATREQSGDADIARRWRKLFVCLIAPLSPVGWATIALCVCSFAFFPWLGWQEILACGLTALLMLLTGVALAMGNTKFDASMALSDHHLAIGDTLSITVTFTNAGKRSTTKAQANLCLGTDTTTFVIPRMQSVQQHQTTVFWNAKHRTVLAVGPLLACKADPLGLIRRNTTLVKATTVCVHPEILMLDTFDIGTIRDLEGLASKRIVDDDLEFHGLREYAHGDDIRNIHWLSSAKHSTPMLRQFEATNRADIVIGLNTDAQGYATAEEFELAVSIFASIGVSCISASQSLIAYAGALRLNTCATVDFLDATSGIAMSQESSISTYIATMTQHGNDVSAMLTVIGSGETDEAVTTMACALPRQVYRIVVRMRRNASCAISHCEGYMVATVGALGDLPRVMGAIP